MINEKVKENYLHERVHLEKQYEHLKRKFSNVSTMRMLSFMVGAGLFIVGTIDAVLWAGILGVIFLLIFACFVGIHSRIVNETEYTKNRIDVVERYIMRYSDEWRNFRDTGDEFLTKQDTVAQDIDLLGPNSLYQMISVAHTIKGKKKLADTLKMTDVPMDKLLLRKEAVGELATNIEFPLEFECAGIGLEKKKKSFLTDKFSLYCLDENMGTLPGWAKYIRYMFPIIFWITIALWIMGMVGYGVPLVVFLVILSFSWLTKTVTDQVISHAYGVQYGVEDYLHMMEIIGKTEFESQLLKDIKEGLDGKEGAIAAFRKLKTISQAYNLCFNPLVHQVLSGVLVWDYQLAAIIMKWKRIYGAKVAASFEMIGQMEELSSLAVLGRIRKTGWATIDLKLQQDIYFECEDLYHPLINPEKVISNSAYIQHGITIITGSNMSGKTTFLRTMAVNLVLAYAGAPICGTSLKTGIMRLFTSMRVTDDVANGISTFYAEILRIKAMAEYRREEKPMLCLIDEIFKGTNSADRIVGATEAITKLAGKSCMTIVSTHDFELCSIRDREDKGAVNYHFQEHYVDGELRFDYKIKDGRCTTTNAKKLLKMAGF